MTEPSITELEQYLNTHGKHASMTLSLLGKLQPFLNALNSELGQELLKDDIVQHEILLTKIYNENATIQELAEFRYLKNRLRKIAERVNTYNEKVREITKK